MFVASGKNTGWVLPVPNALLAWHINFLYSKGLFFQVPVGLL